MIKHLRNNLFVFTVLLSCLFAVSYGCEQISSLAIHTIHGDLVITDPLIIALIHSPAMQRLKEIRQYGTTDYILQHQTIYNRFDHSLGVYYFLFKHGAGRAEQIAGLLHDVSHTVFSHSCDPLFMGDLTKGAYQDLIHDEFLARYGIKNILAQYGFSVADVSPKNKQFRALEQESPALCADRIEYIIYAAHMDNLLPIDDIESIRRDLHFDGHDWYFDSIESAKKFALIPLHQTVYMWGAPNNILIVNWTCQALKRALAIGLVEKEDIFYHLTDDEMWQKLQESDDPEIARMIYNIMHCNLLFSWPKDDDADIVNLKAKFRGVDPLVKTAHGLKLLSELDAEFKQEYELVKQRMQKGWDIVVHDGPMSPMITKRLSDPRLELKNVQSLQNNNSIWFADLVEQCEMFQIE